MPRLTSISPQFLVANLQASIDYYCKKLGFEPNIRYEDFYASVRRDGAEIHLKLADQLPGERQHRKANEHIDAYIVVDNVADAFDEATRLGASIWRELAVQPWGVQDFYVEDVDGHIICFGQLDD